MLIFHIYLCVQRFWTTASSSYIILALQNQSFAAWCKK